MLCSTSTAAEVFWGVSQTDFPFIPSPLGQPDTDQGGTWYTGVFSYTQQQIRSAIQLELQQTVLAPKDALKDQTPATPDNPPFAGWSSLSIGYYQATKPAYPLHTEHLTIQHLMHPSIEIGWTGPSSQAERLSKLIDRHQHGWNDQLVDSQKLMLRYDHTLNIHHQLNQLLGIAIEPHGTLVFGQPLQYMAYGAHIRLGSYLTDSLGPPRFALTGATHTPNQRSLTDSYWNIFIGLEHRHMHQNTLLTGQTIQGHSQLVTLNPTVTAIHLGGQVSLFNLRAMITFEKQTPDYTTQASRQYLTRLGISYDT